MLRRLVLVLAVTVVGLGAAMAFAIPRARRAQTDVAQPVTVGVVAPAVEIASPAVEPAVLLVRADD